MSYILEALKKAQAERQLGHAPTLDAVPVGAAPADHPARPLPLVAIALAVAAVVAAGGWWGMKGAPAPAPASAPAAAPAAAPVAGVPPPAAVLPTPAPAPSTAPPPLVVTPPSAPVRVKEKAPVEVAARPAPPAPVKSAPVKASSADEDRVPTLRELPEATRAAIPQLSFGGYMYSANPADRLILVDKVLRHEGEEVAPGLVLEKLLPKAALMNYRGTRYKVPY
jgi:general secretion pathway protein B